MRLRRVHIRCVNRFAARTPACLIAALAALALPPAGAQDRRAVPDEPRDAPRDESPGERQRPVSVRLGLDYPLRANEDTPDASIGAGAQGAPAVSPTAQAGLRWTPIAGDHWFAHATFLRYLRPSLKRPWNPEFTYGFGYDDWHPFTWSFTYANYNGNRLDPDRANGEHRWNFERGTWSAAYKFSLPEAWKRDAGDQFGCSAGLNLTPRYTQASDSAQRNWKKSLALGCRYALESGWFVRFTAINWPEGAQQQPWDPDFTYGFGYFNWRPGGISVQYNNYSGNRWPGRARAPRQGTFRNGSLSVSWNLPW